MTGNLVLTRQNSVAPLDSYNVGGTVLLGEVDEPEFGEYTLFNEHTSADVWLLGAGGVPGVKIEPGKSYRFTMHGKHEIRVAKAENETDTVPVLAMVTRLDVAIAGVPGLCKVAL